MDTRTLKKTAKKKAVKKKLQGFSYLVVDGYSKDYYYETSLETALKTIDSLAGADDYDCLDSVMEDVGLYEIKKVPFHIEVSVKIGEKK